MTLEDIVDIINDSIEDKRTSANIHVLDKQQFVLQRTIVPNKTFKAFKAYTITLWIVGDTTKYKVLSVSYQVKFPLDSTDSIDKAFVKSFLNNNSDSGLFIGINKIIEDVIYGKYSAE